MTELILICLSLQGKWADGSAFTGIKILVTNGDTVSQMNLLK